MELAGLGGRRRGMRSARVLAPTCALEGSVPEGSLYIERSMVLLQALLSFLGRSAGKVLNAIFGWAVIALFGRTSSRQQTLLSGVVAMAVLWPLLLAGILAP